MAGSLWSPEAPLAGRVEVEEDVGSSQSGAEAEALQVVDIMWRDSLISPHQDLPLPPKGSQQERLWEESPLWWRTLRSLESSLEAVTA